MKAQGRSRGIALLILNLGARWGWMVNATPGRFTLERLVSPWTGLEGREEEKISCLPTDVRTPNRPA